MSTLQFTDSTARRAFYDRRLERMRRRADATAPGPTLADRLGLGLTRYTITPADYRDSILAGSPYVIGPFPSDPDEGALHV